jgi:hypothetical protein
MSSKMNLLLALNVYNDLSVSSHPSKNVSKWVSDLQGIDITEPSSASISLASGQTLSLFSGEVVISDDNTTTYDLSLKTGTTNTYTLAYNSGTAPVFRTNRALGTDATSEITITKNGTLLVFSFTAGPILSLSAVVVGDEVRIGSFFNVANQGKFKILSVIAGQFTIENASGQAEGPILLDTDFANQVVIQSAAGVQVGQKVKISSGFSSVSFGTYEITDVSPASIELYSIKSLPSETDVSSDLQIFSNSKKFLFVESDKKTSLLIDGAAGGAIEPFAIGTSLKSGMFLRNSSMYSASITNESQETATIYYMSGE